MLFLLFTIYASLPLCVRITQSIFQEVGEQLFDYGPGRSTSAGISRALPLIDS